MKISYRKSLPGLLCLAVVISLVSFAQDKHTADAINQAQKASKVFTEIMSKPDKSVPTTLLDKAYCVGVFPQVLKAGFIVGGRGGRGVASCRTNAGWSGPAYFDLKGGSFGLQIGAEAIDFIFLFMTPNGIDSLLKSKFELGGDASVAAGPVGRQAGAATDIRLNAQILSYSRSKGIFAGLEIKGSVISLDKDDMTGAYGAGVTPEDVLRGRKVAPVAIKVFPNTLARYSKRRR